MTMNKANLNLQIVLTFLFLSFNSLEPAGLLLGTIQFPRNVVISESIPVYTLGTCIKSTVHKENACITFDIPSNPRQTDYFIFVTDKKPIPVYKKGPDGKSSITVDYFTVDQTSAYQLFELHLVREQNENKVITTRWTWSREKFQPKQRIPDHAIIILYDPSQIEELRGGTDLELPTIVIRHDSSVESQQINESILKLQLESIDLNTFHAPIKQVVHHNKQKEKTVLVIPTL